MICLDQSEASDKALGEGTVQNWSRAGIEGRLKQNYLKIFEEHFREISF